VLPHQLKKAWIQFIVLEAVMNNQIKLFKINKNKKVKHQLINTAVANHILPIQFPGQ
jgi:hypothetical protein